LKHRINDLEKRGSTDGDIPQILVVWDNDELQDMQPGDIVVSWDDIDDNVTKPIKGEGEANNGQDD
jgi:hypothetical protein